MTALLLLRHGPTDWNAAHRLQGHSDQPLSAASSAQVALWQLPAAFEAAHWLTSPLQRARQTAALLGHPDAEIEPALIEMDWGRWEGETLEALRQRYGTALAAREAKGLDFRPDGGESPRDVQLRLAPWLRRLGAEGRPTIAVCHKGVIRALHALASDWDMTGPPARKLRAEHAHAFRVAGEGRIAVEQLNLPLLP